MSYHIYTTLGLVLSERPLREADRIYTIFTRDLGLLRASATGVRWDLSKLRGHLEPFSLVSVSLVRGREYWRLTSAELIESLKTRLSGKTGIFMAFAKNFSLLEKLVAGEEKHAELFDAINDIIQFAIHEDFSPEDAESVEILLAVRILFNLGYLSGRDISDEILTNLPTKKNLVAVAHAKKTLIRAINHGIESSQLA